MFLDASFFVSLIRYMSKKEIEESFVYKLGDLAWFVPYGAKRAVQGEIVAINLEIEEAYVSLMEIVESKYRTTRPDLLADTAAEAKKFNIKRPHKRVT